jgi:hypothetical protein
MFKKDFKNNYIFKFDKRWQIYFTGLLTFMYESFPQLLCQL